MRPPLPSDSRPWTTAEDAILRASYSKDGIEGAKAALPERTEGAIYHRARRLGVKRRRRWTRADDTHLAMLWDEGIRLPAIAKRLGRTVVTTYCRAQKIGLPLGCPEGFEYLTAAAKRTGFAAKTLRNILRWAEKPVRAALARPVKASWRHQIVDPFDVDEAIAAWMATEPAETAARRLGISGERLRARLRAIGVKTGRDRHARVTEEQLRAANAIAKWDRRTKAAAAGALSRGGTT